MASGVSWDDEEIARRLNSMPARIDAGLTAVIEREAPQSETYMKSHARWTDQTGNARQGLSARPERRRLETYMVVLFHTVSYGIWLEVRFSGRYAIIDPALRQRGEATMVSASRLFERIFAS